VAPEANSNGPVCAPSRRAAATAATPIASTAHSSGDPRGSATTALGSSQAASLAKCPAISAACSANRLSQPRTVESGTPKAAAI
jgi:hypothetical protein